MAQPASLPFFQGLPGSGDQEGAAEVSATAGSSGEGLWPVAGGFSTLLAEAVAPRTLPNAPGGPATHQLSLSGRGVATAPPEDGTIMPGTIGAYAKSLGTPPAGLPEFLGELGADEALPLSDLCCMAEGDLIGALDNTFQDGEALTPRQRAGIIKLVRAAFTQEGFDPPAMGGCLPKAAPAAPPAQQPQLQPTQREPQSEHTVAMADVIDQTSSAHVRPLTFSELSLCRRRYKDATGDDPPEEQLPSAEQLSALRALLNSGRAPFVDFAVWSPFGTRLARFRKTEACVFVGSTLVQKRIDGPSSFEAWLSSWDLFAVAMVSLGAAKIGTLNKFRSGMVQLARIFPRHWPVLLTTDTVLRTERWGRLREQVEDMAQMGATPPGFNPHTPWDYIIGVSAYGSGGLNAEWWQSHFVLPCTVSGGAGGASSVIRSVEGYPDVSLATDLPAPKGGQSDHQRASKPKPPAKRSRDTGPDNAGEICGNYNSGIGACAKDGPCKHKRRHVCDVCGGMHRRIEKHGGQPDKQQGRQQNTSWWKNKKQGK